MASRSSRLSRRTENQTKKSIFLSIAGIIVILFLLVKFGIPLLINTSTLLSTSKNDDTTKKESVFVAAPVLDTVPDATNSAVYSFSGKANAKEEVVIFVNDEEGEQKETQEDGSFAFNDVKLKKGANTIAVKAKIDKSTSDFSNELQISYKSGAPKLSIEAPDDNHEYHNDENRVNVSGTTDPGAKITVNDLWAIVDDSGKYSYTLPLKDGDNDIKVVATDEAGNTTTVSRKVKFTK